MKRKKTQQQDADDVELVEESDTTATLKTKNATALRDALATARAQASEYLDGWQRAKADLINFKRETEEKRAQQVKYATEDLVAQIIPVLDSFDMAFRNTETWHQAPENWRRGVEYIHAQLLSVLKENGVQQLSPLHECFDPALHDSAETRSVDSPEREGIILDVIQRGYALHDKLIRAPKVIVGHYHG